MKKNIVLIYILAISMVFAPLAVAAPKGKEGKKTEKKAKQEKKGKKSAKGDAQQSEKKNSNPKLDKNKGQDKKKQLEQEIKEWDQKKKSMKPLQLKDLVEENHQLRMKNGEMQLAVVEIQKKLDEAMQGAGNHAESEVERQKVERQKIVEIQKQTQTNLAFRDLSELPPGSYTINQETGEVLIGGVVDPRYGVNPQTGIPFIKGIIFKVQMGARYDLDLKDVLIDEVNHETLEQEVAEGLYKYTIGHFRNYWEADKLKKGLRSMGIELAWIVPYKDGERVLLKEVLPAVLDQKEK